MINVSELFSVYIAVNSHMSYTKADLLLLWTCSKEEGGSTAGLWWLLNGAAERSHERALEGNTPKNALLGTSRRALLPTP